VDDRRRPLLAAVASAVDASIQTAPRKRGFSFGPVTAAWAAYRAAMPFFKRVAPSLDCIPCTFYSGVMWSKADD
jgi:hypothetical protein